MSSSTKRLLKILTLSLIAFMCLTFLVNMSVKTLRNDSRQASLNQLSYFSDFSLTLFDRETGTASEETFTSDDLKNYKVIFFNGWGPWCNACIGEMPYLQTLAEEYKSKGLLVVGVVAGYYDSRSVNTDEQIDASLDSMDILYPNLLADERFYREVVPTMGNVYPSSWAVDSDGNLIEYVSGGRTEDRWRDLFDQWLEGK